MSPFQGLMFWFYYNVKGLKGRNTLAQVEGLRNNGVRNLKSDFPEDMRLGYRF